MLPGGSGIAPPIRAYLGRPSTSAFSPARRVSISELLGGPILDAWRLRDCDEFGGGRRLGDGESVFAETCHVHLDRLVHAAGSLRSRGSGCDTAREIR